MMVESEDEASIDGDAGVLDAVDGFGVAVGLVHFPVGLVFDAIEVGGSGTFESDEDLGAAAFLHEAEQFVIPCHGNIGFREPAQAEWGHGAAEFPSPLPVGKGIVVGEFQKRMSPEAADRMDFVHDLRHGLGPVAGCEADAGSAEITVVGTSALCLHGQPIVPRNVQQIEPRHGSVGEIEAGRAGIVAGLQLPGQQVAAHGRPDGFAFPDDHAVGMPEGFIRPCGHVESAHEDRDAGSPAAVGQRVGLANLRGETRNGDGIEIAGQTVELLDVGHFHVAGLDFRRGQAGQREQSETWERGNDFAAFHETGKGQTDGEQFFIPAADAGHGDES